MKRILPIETILETPEKQGIFVTAVVNQMETEIGKLSMIKGLFVKKTYAAVKAVRPGYVRHIIEVLSKDYIHEFSQMHSDFRASQPLPSEHPVPFIQYINEHRKEAETHFWVVADKYGAKKADSMLGRAYKAGRSTIASHLPLVFEIICAQIDKQTVVDE